MWCRSTAIRLSNESVYVLSLYFSLHLHSDRRLCKHHGSGSWIIPSSCSSLRYQSVIESFQAIDSMQIQLSLIKNHQWIASSPASCSLQTVVRMRTVSTYGYLSAINLSTALSTAGLRCVVGRRVAKHYIILYGGRHTDRYADRKRKYGHPQSDLMDESYDRCRHWFASQEFGRLTTRYYCRRWVRVCTDTTTVGDL